MAVVAFSSIFLLTTSCEKEKENSSFVEQNTKNIKTGKEYKSHDKSTDDRYNNVLSFIDAITNGGVEVNDYAAEETLLYTEATLNYRLTSNNHLPSESKQFETNYQLNIESDEGILIVDSLDIQAMNDYLYDEIYQNADSYIFENGNKDGKYISVIDLEWGTISAGTQNVTVNYTIHNFTNQFIPSCDFVDSWYPVLDSGGCNGNPATTSDAAQEINSRVNYRYCNNILRPNCSEPLWYDIKQSVQVYPSSKYTTNSIWNGKSSDCISATRMNELKDSCIWMASQFNFYRSTFNLKSITVGSSLILIPNSTNDYTHWYQFTYGECIANLTYRLEPDFY